MRLAYYLQFVLDNVKARLGDRERGAALVEYALLVALIAVVCIAAITFLGTEAEETFSSIGDEVGTP